MKLFITDLDGTLLDNETHASEINMQALHDLKKEGYEIVIATGRQYRVIQTMGLESLKPYIIALNGSIIYDPEGNVIYENVLDPTQLQHICKTSDTYDLLRIVYTKDQMYITYPKTFIHQIYDVAKQQTTTEAALVDFLEEFIAHHLCLPMLSDEVMQNIMKGNEVACKVEVTSNQSAFLDGIENALQGDFCVASSWATNREITTLNVNKGTAMEALCKHLNITLKDCVTIGDNRNDVEMLEMAGFSIAMGNADDTIKNLCDAVSETCKNHGVAYAIKNLLHK